MRGLCRQGAIKTQLEQDRLVKETNPWGGKAFGIVETIYYRHMPLARDWRLSEGRPEVVLRAIWGNRNNIPYTFIIIKATILKTLFSILFSPIAFPFKKLLINLLIFSIKIIGLILNTLCFIITSITILLKSIIPVLEKKT